MQRCHGDLCSASKCSLPAGTGSVDFHGAACPLQAGDITLDFDVQVSRFVPSSLAHLDIEIESTGSAGKLLCAKIKTSPGLSEESEAECVAPNFNLVSQTNEGIVTTSLAGHRAVQPFMEKVDLEKFNVRGESTLELKTPLGKQQLTQKHILSIERKRFVVFLEAKGMLTGDHSACVKMALPPKLPELEVFAELFRKFSGLLECKETDGAVDTWRTSASFKQLSAELEIATSPDSLLHWANENVTIGPLPPLHADLLITSAALGGPEEADLDETQFGDCKEIPMPWDSTDVFADYPGFWTKHILAVVQQMQESVVV